MRLGRAWATTSPKSSCSIRAGALLGREPSSTGARRGRDSSPSSATGATRRRPPDSMTTPPTAARLGRHTVNRTGLGAMQLAGPHVFGPPADPAAARAVLCRAIELGVDHIDTAQYYGPDVVNELIRDALHPYPAGLRIVSKVGARRDSRGGVLSATHPDELRAGVEANLQTLQVDSLALVNLRLMSPDEDGIALAEQLGALKPLQDEGKIESIGLSNASVDEVASALEMVDLGEVQNAYNVKLREGEDVLRLCAERD